ncbi:hypothetical protein SAMN05192583_1017 [Sphingomonas gellani]|uniref:Uncharacterized protein n=1 Tax=Sphingomonas gellani TaxID=1166340 RepID=A0A1H8AT05_9SPHN|nr:hypothetical protein [Sphingomonas gellani]SEM72939.1 hypothetical protein SAMN05192583_1017 [Sphingomonas gellani]
MTRPAQISRSYHFERPTPLLVEIHDHDCPCCTDLPPVPYTIGDVGKLLLAGMGIGVAIGAVCHPLAFAASTIAIAQDVLQAFGL